MPVLVGRDPYQLLDRRLARPVRAEERVDQPAGDGRHPDERAVAGFDELGQRVLQAQEGAERVQMQDADELGGVLLAGGCEPATASRIGDAARQAAGGLRGERDRLGDRLLLGDIGDDVARAAADALYRVLQARLGAPADGDVRAVLHEPRGTGPSDAGAAAGDEDGMI